VAKVQWWQRIADPDTVVKRATSAVSDRRVRYITAARSSGLFQDEPEILQAFVNADVPLSVAHRTMAELTKVKAKQRRNLYTTAGYGNESMTQAQADEESDAQAGEQPLSFSPAENRLAPPGIARAAKQEEPGFWGHLAGLGEGIVGGIGDALTAISSPLQAPKALGSAMPDSAPEKWVKGNEWIQSIPVVGQMGVTLAESVLDWSKGVSNLVAGDAGGDVVSQDQQRLMRGAGYDPNSRASRYAYYYEGFNQKRKAVADDDVAKLKNEYDPRKVQLAVELVTSGFFEDPARSIGGLSPEAQGFARGLGAAPQDSEDARLIKAVQDNNTLGFGAALANRFGGEMGGGQRAAVGAFGDLAVYWFADPLVVGAKGMQAVKYSMNGVAANSIDDTVKMLAASGDNFKPKGFAAKALDDAMRVVDSNFHLMAANRMDEAAKSAESFRRLHPDMMPVYDALMATRSGSVTRLRPREGGEILSEAEKARRVNRQQQSWTYDSGKFGESAPVWKLSDSFDEAVSAERSATERAKMADTLGEFIFMEALTSGRPLYKGKMLLPGQVAVNRRVRDGIASVRDFYSRTDKKFWKNLEEARGKHKIELDGDVVADAYGRAEILLDKATTDAVKRNYYGSIGSPTLGISRAFGRAWSKFEKSFSGKTINFDSPESTELFRRWAVEFLPKRQAYALTNEFAASNPARRYALMQQTVSASLSAAGLRSTSAARRTSERLLKGLAPRYDEAGRTGSPLEMYTNPIDNTIKIGEYDAAAAVWPHQVTEGWQMPNLRELKRVINRHSVLGYAAGTLNNDTMDVLTSWWKVAMVANPANMVRQALEAYAFTTARNPEILPEIVQARVALKAAKGLNKAETHDLQRLAGKLEDVVDGPTLARIDEAIKTGNNAEYSTIIRDALEKNGIKGRHADILTRMGETVDIRDLAPGPIHSMALALAGPLDWYRKLRFRTAEKAGISLEELINSPFEKYLSETVLSQYTESMLHAMGAAADNYALGAERFMDDTYDRTTELMNQGFGVRTPRVPNSYQYTDSYSTQAWAEDIQKLQADELGNLILRRIAAEEIGKVEQVKMLNTMLEAANAKGALVPSVRIDKKAGMIHARKKFLGEEFTRRSQGVTDPAEIAQIKADLMALERYSPQALETPAGFAAHLIGADDLGRILRDASKRSNYTSSGRAVETAEDRAEAVSRHAEVMVRDAVTRLGGRYEDGRVLFSHEVYPLLEKIADGKRVNAKDLVAYSDELRPPGLVKELYVPDLGQGKNTIRRRLVQAASKTYSAIVAQPLAAYATHPTVIAHRYEAYTEMMPVFSQLKARGMSDEQAAYLLEGAANRRALNLTFNVTDNPGDHSVFAELTDNFLMFNRAQEDFLRRFLKAVSADPALLARTKTLVDAAHHAGVVSMQKFSDEEGNEKEQLVFTYPGSAAMVKTIGDAWASMGGEMDNLHGVPQFKGFSAQVRFVNPSINNPLQFSSNPFMAMPLRFAREMFPEHAQDITEVITAMEGGSRYFAEKDTMEQFLPAALTRLVPIVAKDERDGQYASALRTALTYAEAAGILPEPGQASPDQIQDAQDSVRSMVQNIMVQRAVFGMFAPAAPSLGEPETDMKVNALAMAEGVTSLRGEWFDVLEWANVKYPQNGALALSEAHVEWARRYPKGKSIANPEAFTVGTSQMAGSEKAAPSNAPTTQWMLDNLDWVRENQAVAYHLLPTMEGDKWYEAAPYRLQFRQELREHKSLEEFYRDVTMQDELAQFYKMTQQLSRAKMLDAGNAKGVQAAFDQWKAGWEAKHPGVAAELDRRQDPNYAHSQIAPALGRLAEGQLPKELEPFKGSFQEMYSDYMTYRRLFAEAPRNQKASVNAKYREYGKSRWSVGPLSQLWNALDVYEDR
jgi:hypothetical protein